MDLFRNFVISGPVAVTDTNGGVVRVVENGCWEKLRDAIVDGGRHRYLNTYKCVNVVGVNKCTAWLIVNVTYYAEIESY